MSAMATPRQEFITALSRQKFTWRAWQLTKRTDLRFEWQENGDCIVNGIIYLTLKSD